MNRDRNKQNLKKGKRKKWKNQKYMKSKIKIECNNFNTQRLSRRNCFLLRDKREKKIKTKNEK